MGPLFALYGGPHDGYLLDLNPTCHQALEGHIHVATIWGDILTATSPLMPVSAFQLSPAHPIDVFRSNGDRSSYRPDPTGGVARFVAGSIFENPRVDRS